MGRVALDVRPEAEVAKLFGRGKKKDKKRDNDDQQQDERSENAAADRLAQLALGGGNPVDAAAKAIVGGGEPVAPIAKQSHQPGLRRG